MNNPSFTMLETCHIVKEHLKCPDFVVQCSVGSILFQDLELGRSLNRTILGILNEKGEQPNKRSLLQNQFKFIIYFLFRFNFQEDETKHPSFSKPKIEKNIFVDGLFIHKTNKLWVILSILFNCLHFIVDWLSAIIFVISVACLGWLKFFYCFPKSDKHCTA